MSNCYMVKRSEKKYKALNITKMIYNESGYTIFLPSLPLFISLKKVQKSYL